MSLPNDGSPAHSGAFNAGSRARYAPACIESPHAELCDQIVISRFVDPPEPEALRDPDEHIQVNYPLGRAPSSADEDAMLQACRHMLDDEVNHTTDEN